VTVVDGTTAVDLVVDVTVSIEVEEIVMVEAETKPIRSKKKGERIIARSRLNRVQLQTNTN